MKCEMRWHGKEFCPKEAKVLVNGIMRGEQKLCHDCAGKLLLQYGSEEKVKEIKSIGCE